MVARSCSEFNKDNYCHSVISQAYVSIQAILYHVVKQLQSIEF